MSLKAKPMPCLDYLNSILEFKDGLLYNKITRNSRAVAGKLAGAVSGKYKSITLFGEPFLLHRITFYMFYGYCPDFVDHINGDKQNSHIDNLRSATKKQNQWNQGLSKVNSSGVKGLSWAKSQNKWLACIRHNGKNKNLGYFETQELGAEFLELARDMFHGKFANHGYKEKLSCR